MSEKIRIVPTTVRIEKVRLIDFLSDMREIIKGIEELANGTPTGVNFRLATKGSMNIALVGADTFNISCSDPETLDKLVEAAKKFYEGQ